MTIEEVLAARLIAQVPSVVQRVYPVLADQATAYPMLVYSQVSETSYYAFGSAVSGVRTGRWNVACYGATYGDAKVAADEVCAALERYSATVSGLEVIDVFKELEIDHWDGESRVFHTSLDFIVHHRN